MRPWAKWALIVLVVLFVGIQFLRPARTNPPEDAAKMIFADSVVWQNAPKSIERACFDCHSHRTRWPWYSNVAPVSWLVASDVAEGRQHMNFSKWADYPPWKKAALLADTCKFVDAHKMPLPIYIPMHSEAKLTDQERKEICAWTGSALTRMDQANK
jgi:hypothetical protein